MSRVVAITAAQIKAITDLIAVADTSTKAILTPVVTQWGMAADYSALVTTLIQGMHDPDGLGLETTRLSNAAWQRRVDACKYVLTTCGIRDEA